jgi:riboflavin kinase/FMN adenylyltransferase
MEIFCGLPSPSKRLDCALTIGNFDGVHRGHQALLARLVGEARHRGLPSCVMTFDPHPRAWFALRRGQAEQAPARIGTLRDKAAELKRCGVDRLVVVRFDEAFAQLTPQAFIDDVLCDALRVRHVLVGDDFRFGAARKGDCVLLQQAGGLRGFDVAGMPSHEVSGLRVSSSSVREALARGRLAHAATLLGRPYGIGGRIVRGGGHGTRLGFPSMNLRIGPTVPAAQGTFAVRVKTQAGTVLSGMGCIGMQRAPDGGTSALLRVHVFEWPAGLGPDDSLGHLVRVELLHRLHDGQALGSSECSREEVARDVLAARSWCTGNHPLSAGAGAAPVRTAARWPHVPMHGARQAEARRLGPSRCGC